MGVDDATRTLLRRHNVHTVGDAALVHPEVLRQIAGAAVARRLTAIAYGTDASHVTTTRAPRSFAVQRAVGRGSAPDLDALATELASRLHHANLTCDTVAFTFNTGDGAEHRTRVRLASHTDDPKAIADAIAPFLVSAAAVTRIGMTVTGLRAAGEAAQLALDIPGGAPT